MAPKAVRAVRGRTVAKAKVGKGRVVEKAPTKISSVMSGRNTVANKTRKSIGLKKRVVANQSKVVASSSKAATLVFQKPAPTKRSATLEGDELKMAEAFMSSAAASALAGVRICHGGPFGASVVRDGVIISCAHNMVLRRADPTCHAEMNAIQQACQALGTHDLSDCDLYTTCEPCPMCWGAVQWSGLGKVHIGVDRYTAAKYGFDDKVFYDEIDAKAGLYGLHRCGYTLDSNAQRLEMSAERVHKNMVEVHDGLCHREIADAFANPDHNRTLKRRFAQDELKRTVSGEQLAIACEPVQKLSEDGVHGTSLEEHERFMKMAIQAAEQGVRRGRSKGREPFGSVIVKDGIVIAQAHNSVLETRDATATAEVCAIRAATMHLGTHNLEGCSMYTTTHPDLMSLGAILWARISRVYCGVTQQLAAKCGFEEGISHFKDLLAVQEAHRLTHVIEGVAKPECEAVFKEWSDRNGVIY